MSLDPTTDPTPRIGDAEREHTVAALGRHLSDGRLTMAEFENRLDTVYAATTRADLDAVLADLPTVTQPSPPPLRRPRSRQHLGRPGRLGYLGRPGCHGR